VVELSYTVFSKDRKSLQFPVMCNGYVHIKAADSFNQETTGIWDYEGPFTLEMLVTPYEINGNPVTDNEASQKSLPRDATYGLTYLSSANRHSVEMCLFHNNYITVSLVNTTTQAFQQPAEYSIKFSLTIDGTTQTLESPTVFRSEVVDNSYSNPTEYFYINHLPAYKKYAQIVSIVDANTMTIADTSVLNASQPIYYIDGDGVMQSSGTIDTITDATTFDIAGASTNNFSVGDYMYIPVDRDVLYPETSHHLAVSYGYGRMFIAFNGGIVAERGHAGEFQLDASDIYLGQNPNAATPRLTQFMGELHEVSYFKGQTVSFKSTNSLSPPYKNALLYLDFEEARINE